MDEMLKSALDGKYAVPQLNINNLEWIKYILEECEGLKSPVILGVSEGAAKYMGGYKLVTNLVKNHKIDVANPPLHGLPKYSCINPRAW